MPNRVMLSRNCFSASLSHRPRIVLRRLSEPIGTISIRMFFVVFIFIFIFFDLSFDSPGKRIKGCRTKKTARHRSFHLVRKSPQLFDAFFKESFTRKHCLFRPVETRRAEATPYGNGSPAFSSVSGCPDRSRELRVPPFFQGCTSSLLQAITVYYRALREKANIRVLAATAPCGREGSRKKSMLD